MLEDFIKTAGSQPVLLGNPLRDWMFAALVAIALWSLLWAVRRFVGARFERYSSGKHPTLVRLIGTLIGSTRQIFMIALAVAAGQQFLALPATAQRIVGSAVLILILIQIGFWAGRAVRFYLEIKERERGADRTFAGSLDIINFVSRMAIWSLLFLVALDNLGVNITALLAGLGVGGVAVALALQNVLGDLFASLSIALDKPFVVGDNLTIDGFVGKVEHIGIKTTRMRSESGEQIVLSNADILKSRVRNFGRLSEQRVLTTLRIHYATPAAKLKEIPQFLESIVREQANARFERCHLRTFGDSAFHFELSYFVQQPAVNPMLDLQQAVNFRIIDELERQRIELAYPTQLIYLDRHRAAPQA